MRELPEIRVDSQQLEVHDRRAVAALERAVSKATLIISLSPVAAVALLAASLLLGNEDLALVIILSSTVAITGTTLLALLTIPAMWALSLRGRWRGPGTLVIGTHSLRLQRQGRHELLELEDVVEGRTRRASACILRLAGDRTLVVPTQPARSPEQVLQRLAATSCLRAARFPLHRVRPWLADVTLAMWLLTTIALVLHGTTGGDPQPTIAALTALLAVLALHARTTAVAHPAGRVVAGADAIRIDVDRRTRLIRYGDVRAVRATRRGVVLTLVDGSRLALCVAPSRLRHLLGATTSHDRLAELRAANLAELVQARIAEHTDLGEGAVADPDSSIDDWRTAIGGALAGLAGAYRQGALTPAQAAAIAEDPRAAAPQRIGAALAIADDGDRDARTRVRIAADLSADDELRAALEEAAHGVLHPATRTRFGKVG